MCLLYKIISDIKYILALLAAFTFLLPNGIHAGKCYSTM